MEKEGGSEQEKIDPVKKKKIILLENDLYNINILYTFLKKKRIKLVISIRSHFSPIEILLEQTSSQVDQTLCFLEASNQNFSVLDYKKLKLK